MYAMILATAVIHGLMHTTQGLTRGYKETNSISVLMKLRSVAASVYVKLTVNSWAECTANIPLHTSTHADQYA